MESGLDRFVEAQNPVWDRVMSELAEGRKRSHWMWFVFPQLAGLGRSPTARHFALSGLDEAKIYLEHPVLGPRLRECTRAMLAHSARSLPDILGFPDDLKFRSSMTLFAELDGPDSIFRSALEAFCGGQPDLLTLQRLGREAPPD
jgi:uncharacterized protein (DUF1810 family)